MQYVTNKYSEDNFQAGCYWVVELLDENFIEVDLARAKWTKVVDGQWEIHPAKQKVNDPIPVPTIIIIIFYVYIIYNVIIILLL